MKNRQKLYIAIYLLFIFLIANAVCYFIITTFAKVSIYSPDYKELQKKYIKNPTNTSSVHPFYGVNLGKDEGFESNISSEYNFNTISKKPLNGEIKILILGGSVGQQLSQKRDEHASKDFLFSSILNQRFHTDRFVVYNASIAGGKQPQQYFKLIYLDFLGFSPDLIINYDGFNEMALPFTENLNKNLNAVYPRSWNESIHGTAIQGDSCIVRSNNLLQFNSYIPLIETIKILYSFNCHKKVTEGKKPIVLTSKKLFENEKKNYDEKVNNIWIKSSNNIYEFALKKNIEYIHGIQPNQYFPNSKKLSAMEIDKFTSKQRYRDVIPNKYLQLPIEKLKAKNITDQRMLFKELSQTLYSDSCCHFNDEGLTLLINGLIDSNKFVFEELLNKS